ncbi:sulfite reductase SirA [Actinoallomurus bryophytorum]|uniref:assimilatory sulfite reductase (ferredoxin) n=1 Tax=Actinoallomurus bryophytorum TaxID=1490222 RepID=A0A543CSS2_9ACTN|nr:nitrite/sulfite reductase [Actinoallomurus bryophytorum]TQL99967.1 sulfite reductase (ferredoxin) [Actinoallomurus bryophytorum]
MPPRQQRRGEGQWALGYREPLNKNEENKKNDDGLNVRDRIVDIYSKAGFDSIDPADLRGRFRWYGLYTQRRPGIDGGKTAILEDEDLDDRYFMMRVRIDGGQLSPEQLRAIADVSTKYARGTADLTDRQNIQLHWVEIESVPAIWETLESVGLSTTEACGDTPRVILGCPLAGIDADEVIDATPQIHEINERYIGSPEFSNLPRKFKSALSGCTAQCTVHEINDIAFVGVVNDDGEKGYDIWVGGGLSTNPMFGKRLGAFVRPDQVHEVWAGVAGIFRDYGYRRLRHRARIKFLMNDWGPERFRELLEKDYLGYALPDGPAPGAPAGARRDHVGIRPQRDGNYYVGFAPKVGRINGELLHVIADLAQEYGSGRVRTTTEQKMVILDVPEERTEALAADLEANDLQVRPSTFRRQTMACTGIEFCKLAIVETKQRGMDLISELEERLPDFEEPLTININGCPNSCARIQVADIGLKGQLVTDADGNQVEGYQIHLGGSIGGAFGKKVRGLKTTADELPDYVERVLRRFQKQKTDGESFADWVQRAEQGDLA